jgi:hypothetical protein
VFKEVLSHLQISCGQFIEMVSAFEEMKQRQLKKDLNSKKAPTLRSFSKMSDFKTPTPNIE